jgi:hypothetical protein
VGYVVKAESASGLKMWVSPPRQRDRRIFGPRQDAEVFRTEKEAQAVIDTLAESFERVGFQFNVERSG